MSSRMDYKINIQIFRKTDFFFRICLVIILSAIHPGLTNAETIEKLQHNASTAYEQMMQAKQTAETLAKDATIAEKKLASIKQKLTTAEQEVEAAKKKAEQAKISMEQTINRWKQATDALASEWGKSEVK